MNNKRIDITKDLEKWFDEEVLPKLSVEQLIEIRDNPEIVTNAILKAYKQLCEKEGVDYTTTAMYQDEMKDRREKEEKE